MRIGPGRAWAPRVAVLGLIVTIPAARAARPDAPALSKENKAAIERISPDSIRRHMEVLSADAMEGRDAGSKGYLMAARYAAEQFKKAGAKPAGDNGTYFQEVPTSALQPNPASTVTVHVGGKSSILQFGADFYAGSSLTAPAPINAPLVYAGYGLIDSNGGWDDYAKIDVKDKLVIVLDGSPPGSDAQRARSASSFAKARTAAQKGARGLVILSAEGQLPSARPTQMLKSQNVEPRRERNTAPTVHIRHGAAAPLFEGAPRTLEDVLKAEPASGSGFELKSALTVDLKPAIVADTPNPNVIAMVPGTDGKLKDEYVVYSAHLDHVTGPPVNGDRIYNGALDNASGSAVVLALAEAFANLPNGPRRTMVFLLVTGEEKGFWGSQHYVKNPRFPLSKTAANINIDMIMAWKPSKSVVASGSEKSTLKQVVADAATWLDLGVAPDPFPNERFFYRSDQIVFARAGVPALFLQPGPHWEGMSEEAARQLLQNWLRTRYHRVGDEIQPDWDFRAFQRIAQVAFLMGQRINESDALPVWNPGDEFEAARLKSIQEGK